MHISPDINKNPIAGDVSLEVRGGEEDKFWFRSDRFFTVDSKWYFTTREHRDVGPYVSRTDAVHGLELFIDCVEKQKMEVDYAISIAMRGDWAIARFQ